MKYNKLFIILYANISLFQTFSCSTEPLFEQCERQKASQNFSQFLEDCDYAPVCINHLRNQYPSNLNNINSLLLSHYIDNYRNALSKANSLQEKREILEKKKVFLIAQPAWIDNGYEPILVSTIDGSDRGVNGLRYKALEIVMNEIEETSE